MRSFGLGLLAVGCVLMMSTQAQGGTPEFIYAIDNITVAAGREAQVRFYIISNSMQMKSEAIEYDVQSYISGLTFS